MTTETGASVLNPSSPQAESHNKEGDAKTPESAPVKFGNVKTDEGGVSKVFLMNHASPKSPQVRRTAGEATPEVNHLQPRTGGTAEGAEGAEVTASRSQQTLTKSPNLESRSWSKTEGQVPLDLKESLIPPSGPERLTSSKTQNLESNWRSTAEERQHVGPKVEDRLNPESRAGFSQEYGLNLEAHPELRGQKSVDVMGEKKKKKKEEVKSEGAKKLSLR